MLELRVFGPAGTLADVGSSLSASNHVRRAIVLAGASPGHGLLLADVRAETAHELPALLRAHGVSPDDVALVRLEDLTPPSPRSSGGGALVWLDLIGQARSNARPIARYLVFMVAAGVIAGFGVITVNDTLIVGAMAVSPDTLPITAACIGLVGGQLRLAGRALLTLAVGLAVTCAAAAASTLAARATGRLPANFTVGESALTGLVTIGTGTIGVALAAGVAAMLALETRASSAVGVAISVTTIPAAAYLGVAAALHDIDRVWGTLAVLGVNVAMLLVGGTATLWVQRAFARRAGSPAKVPRP